MAAGDGRECLAHVQVLPEREPVLEPLPAMPDVLRRRLRLPVSADTLLSASDLAEDA